MLLIVKLHDHDSVSEVCDRLHRAMNAMDRVRLAVVQHGAVGTLVTHQMRDRGFDVEVWTSTPHGLRPLHTPTVDDQMDQGQPHPALWVDCFSCQVYKQTPNAPYGKCALNPVWVDVASNHWCGQFRLRRDR